MTSYERISTPDAGGGSSPLYQGDCDSYVEIRAISKLGQESLESTISHSPSKTKPASRHWQAVLGARSIAIIFIGFSVILASCGILLCLWISTHDTIAGGEPPQLLHTIVENGAASQVVTLCAAAIRTSITFQLGLVTAALAALMIETSGTSLADAAAVSIKRASGTGPHELVTAGGIRAACSRGRLGLSLLATLTVFMVVVSTLLSTILLSDFEESNIPGPPVQMDVPVWRGWREGRGGMYSTFELIGRRWQHKPTSAWRFAESERADDDERDAAHDTGDTIVASLPFADEASRVSLMQYEGPASVSNTRTYCYAPEVEDLTDLHWADEGPSLNGTLILRPVAKFLQDLQFPTAELRFKCSVSDYEKGRWPIFMCPTTLFLVDPTVSSEAWNGYLVPFIVTNSTQYLTENFLELKRLDDVKTHMVDDDGVWTSVSNRNHTRTLMKISVCVCSFAGNELRNVSMKGAAIPREPAPTWELHPREDDSGASSLPIGDWNTEALSHQMAGLGSDGLRLSPDDRGLLRLEVKNDYGLRLQDMNGKVDEPYDAENELEGGIGFAMTSHSSYSGVFSEYVPHGVYVSEFQDFLRQTGLLPLAMQSFIARLWQAYYYDNFQESYGRHNVTAVFAKSTLLPTKWRGLAVVLGMVVSHFALVIITTCLFLTKTRASSLWEPWQAVAQVVSPATRDRVGIFGGVESKEVEKGSERGVASTELYRVSYSDAAGRHQLEMSGLQRRGRWRRSSN